MKTCTSHHLIPLLIVFSFVSCSGNKVESPLFECMKIKDAKARQLCREEANNKAHTQKIKAAKVELKEEEESGSSSSGEPITLGMANELAKSGEKDAAIKAYRTILERDPDNSLAHFKLALLLSEKNLYSQALKSLDRVVELRPKWSTGYYYRGVALGTVGRPREMIEDLQKAVELEPGNFEANYQLGMAYRKQGNSEKGELILKKAVQLWDEKSSKMPFAKSNQYDAYVEAKAIIEKRSTQN